MKRRDFITKGTLATAGLSTLLSTSCNSNKTAAPEKQAIDDLLAFVLNEETIQGLQKKMADGVYTAEQLTELYLKRIDEIDKNGPRLTAVIELNPDAVAIARQMDGERKAGRVRGPMHGIPVLIKDNIDTADKMQTTAGSLAMEGHIAAKDAFIIQKLRAAGAVILGKTNLSEWANFRSTSSCSGWSSRGGQTKNPYIIDHNPCGSSSGSGVAVSANLCVVAIGTETDGSITCPAATNGVVGLKPTVGLLSRSGIIPISHTQDTAGPMARTVTDVAILLGALTGIDPDDSITNESNGHFHTDYTKFLDANALKGKRIGIEKKPQGDNQFMHALLKKAIDLLKVQGATIVEIDYLDKIHSLGESEFKVMQYEFKAGLNKYLSKSNAKVKSLKEVIAFNKQNADKAMPYFKQETLELSEEKGGLDSKEYKEALEKTHVGVKELLDEVMQKNKLDAICGLTMGPACSIDMIYGDRWGNVFLTMPAAVSGYPHITVPCGMVYDLPIGLSFFGPAYSESTLIGIGYAYEQASKNRTVPQYKKSFLV
ncbi:amidase [Solitalea canadensis]|uniref:Amidase, Asp-tRNAAsn/Glu-tRNAGln amidotransferase A subunit n=1 Tax=Solitalea canadensis (strain ATCC 29591 / DSM 3403 / JCM 21819 / LMG 8368 / NBRC 15130 / NCIMB 12057 / USAM 9D) TaxID=929556 RepID=H8KRT6_SOLCM|nr:amidase [Solitalea canadensis]AFD07724.1 amidase, Asp-tRNAAsn/Glu-tRNAGln amidotransferase A subunit [Solitalea canadensis DSM 3403]